MNQPLEPENKLNILDEIGARFLHPDTTKIFRGTYRLLHVQYKDPAAGKAELLRGVFAVLVFPISAPRKFISLRYHIEGGEEEIGIIEDPMEFPPETRKLLGDSLANNYFEFDIVRVLKVELKYGLLFFDVQTNQGLRQFEMRWRASRARSYGPHGKVLLDVYENRFVIPDVQQLPKEDRERLTRFIYW